LEEFKVNFRFRRVLFEKYPEELVEPAKVKKVIACSGQVYFDLLDARRNNKVNVIFVLKILKLKFSI